MKYNPEKHHRRSIRLKNYDYSLPGAYFITTVTHNREYLFGEIINGSMQLNEWGEMVRHGWLDIPNHFPNTQLDEFVIMPNHIHGIIFITENYEWNSNNVGAIPNNVGAIHELPQQIKLPHQTELPQWIQRRKMLLPKIIGRFKMNAGKQINQIRQTPGIPVWQRNYFEHIIRNNIELNQIREYIIYNPLNWQTDENYM